MNRRLFATEARLKAFCKLLFRRMLESAQSEQTTPAAKAMVELETSGDLNRDEVLEGKCCNTNNSDDIR